MPPQMNTGHIYTALLCSLLYALASAQGPTGVIPRLAITGKSISLRCPLPISNPAQVQWKDLVYNSGQDPVLIFDSTRNPNRDIASSHVNKDNYKVDEEYTLTISNINMDSDPGEYMCFSTVNGVERVQQYQLSVADTLQCSGVSSLGVGASTNLDCTITYSGNQPILNWVVMDKNGATSPVNSQDRSEIRLGRQSLPISGATPNDDGKKYTCQMTFADVTDECSVTLNVTYPTSTATFNIEKNMRNVGDEVKCMADGNPAPSIVLTREGNLLPPDQTKGKGWSAMIIPEAWLTDSVTIICTASNEVGGQKSEKIVKTTFGVGKAAPKPTPPPTLNPDAEPVESGSSSTIVIVLIVIAVVIGVVSVVCFCCYKKKQKKKRSQANQQAAESKQMMPSSELQNQSGANRV